MLVGDWKIGSMGQEKMQWEITQTETIVRVKDDGSFHQDFYSTDGWEEFGFKIQFQRRTNTVCWWTGTGLGEWRKGLELNGNQCDWSPGYPPVRQGQLKVSWDKLCRPFAPCQGLFSHPRCREIVLNNILGWQLVGFGFWKHHSGYSLGNWLGEEKNGYRKVSELGWEKDYVGWG